MRHLSEFTSNAVSGFRTTHRFLHFADFSSIEEFESLLREARDRHLPVYILGKGSNSFFQRQRITTAVLRNCLPAELRETGGGPGEHLVYASSSTPILKVLHHCQRRSLDSFYFLSSVPGNIGGALAMNAGEDRGGRTIYNYVERLHIYESGVEKVLDPADLAIRHRQTPYTGVHAKLILGATFRFRPADHVEGAIRNRLEWYRENQDTSGPSLGSVFSRGNGYVFGFLKRTRFGYRGSHWSYKYGNWLVCERGSLAGLRLCIGVAKLLHFAVGVRPQLEIIKVR